MSTPRLPTYIKNQNERRERSMQTAFPAKVVGWKPSTNVVELEPQFIETWVNRDGTRQSEPQDFPNIQNVPVLFPRSGSWSITFPIETGSFGLVVCTKYALDVWRSQGQPRDPRDLRRFGMSGAVFHPVNLHPNNSAISGVDSNFMILSDGGTTDFVALAQKVLDELGDIATALNAHTHSTVTGLGTPTPPVGAPIYTAASVAASKVKVQ